MCERAWGRLAFAVFLLTFLQFSIAGVSGAYAQDVALIEASLLHKNLGNWVVLDARPTREWQKGHIPGALSFSWEDYVKAKGSGSYRIPGAKDLAMALGRKGINEHTPVVVYGDANKSWGGEGWSSWVLAWLGHKGPIRLLDGGIQSWRRAGYPLERRAQNVVVKEVEYRMEERHGLNIQARQLEELGKGVIVIDTRSSLEWLTGHIPSAIHIPWTEFYSGTDRRPLRPDALRRLLKDHGVEPGQPTVYYCTAGVRSAYAWMVHVLSGYRGARNYVGGLSDWKEFGAGRASRKGA